jgi:hypothetical protein
MINHYFENDDHFQRLIKELKLASTYSSIIASKKDDLSFEYTKFFNLLHKETEQQLAILYAIEKQEKPDNKLFEFSSIILTWAEKKLFPIFSVKK